MKDIEAAVMQAGAEQLRALTLDLVRQLQDTGCLINQLLNALPGSFILLSPAGQVLAVSPRMAAVFLQNPAAVGLDYRQLSFPVFKDCAADALICDLIRSVVDDGLEYEKVLLDKPSSQTGNICLELSLRILRGADNRPQSILLQCVENIVQFNFLRHQQLRGQKLEKLGTLSAGMIHEIKNPLQAMSGIVQLLQHRYGADETLKQKLDLIMTEIRRINVIVTEFLSFAAEKPNCMAPADPNRLCREVAGIVEGNCRLEEIELRLDLAADLPELMLDSDKIKQVLINLLVNAIDALKQRQAEENAAEWQPEIRLSSVYDFDLNECIITVADNGFGMTEEVLKALNQPFFTTKKHGTGLGVSLSRSIVEEHGGRLDLLTSEGGGLTARVVLPELAGLLALTEILPEGSRRPLVFDAKLDILNTDYHELAAAAHK